MYELSAKNDRLKWNTCIIHYHISHDQSILPISVLILWLFGCPGSIKIPHRDQDCFGIAAFTVWHVHITQLYLCYGYLRTLCINGRITVVASSIDRDQPILVFCHDLQSDRFFKDILDLIKRK